MRGAGRAAEVNAAPILRAGPGASNFPRAIAAGPAPMAEPKPRTCHDRENASEPRC